jgi:hypothetical protein
MDCLVFFLLINSPFLHRQSGCFWTLDCLEKGLPVDITDGTMFRQRPGLEISSDVMVGTPWTVPNTYNAVQCGERLIYKSGGGITYTLGGLFEHGRSVEQSGHRVATVSPASTEKRK